MSNSPLAVYTKISPNSTNPRNDTIKKITIHHMAGNMTLEAYGDLASQPARQMSSNYAIETSGRIGLFCEEKNRSWCSSSAANDHKAITIEVANDGGAPDWHVSDKALEALISLCVDICKRNNIPGLNFTGDATGNLTQHNYFAATECPGPYLKSKFRYIADEVNKQLTAPANIIYRVQAGAYSVKANAAAMVERLKAKGFDACISEDRPQAEDGGCECADEMEKLRVENAALKESLDRAKDKLNRIIEVINEG